MAKSSIRRNEDRLKRARAAWQKAQSQEAARLKTLEEQIKLDELLKSNFDTIIKKSITSRQNTAETYEAELADLYKNQNEKALTTVDAFRTQINKIFEQSQKEDISIRTFAIKERYLKQIAIVIESINTFDDETLLPKSTKKILLDDANSVKSIFEDMISRRSRVWQSIKTSAKNFLKGSALMQSGLGARGLGQSGLGALIASKIQNQTDKSSKGAPKPSKKMLKRSYEKILLEQKQQSITPQDIYSPDEETLGTGSSQPSQGKTQTPQTNRRKNIREALESGASSFGGIFTKTRGLTQQTSSLKIEKILLRHQALLECICENSKTIVKNLELKNRQAKEAQDEQAFETQDTAPTATKQEGTESEKPKKGIFGLLALAGTFLLNKLKNLTSVFTDMASKLFDSIKKLLLKPFKILGRLVARVLQYAGRTLLRLGAQLLARIASFVLSPAAIFAAAGAAGAYATAKIGEAIGGKAVGVSSVYKKAKEYNLSQEGGIVAISKRIREYEQSKGLPLSREAQVIQTGKNKYAFENEDSNTEKPSSNRVEENEDEFEKEDTDLSASRVENNKKQSDTSPQDPSTKNVGSSNPNVSEDLVTRIKRLEDAKLMNAPAGTKVKAYWDNKQWSIGYGTKASGPDEVITKEEAERRLRERLSKEKLYVQEYARYYNRSWSNPQIEALTSFSYNLGSNKLNQLTAYGRRSDKKIAAKLVEYNKANDVVVEGLTKRRKEEQSLFNYGMSVPPNQPEPSSQVAMSSPESTPEPIEDTRPSDTGTFSIPSAFNNISPENFSDAESLVTSRLTEALDKMINFMDPSQKGRQELTQGLKLTPQQLGFPKVDSSTNIAQTNQNFFNGGGMNTGASPVGFEHEPTMRTLIGGMGGFGGGRWF